MQAISDQVSAGTQALSTAAAINTQFVNQAPEGYSGPYTGPTIQSNNGPSAPYIPQQETENELEAPEEETYPPPSTTWDPSTGWSPGSGMEEIDIDLGW
jgi:hypothetical protein